MSIRQMHFFMFPEELIAFLTEECDRLDLVTTVYTPPLRAERVGVNGIPSMLDVKWEGSDAGQVRIMLHPPTSSAQVEWRALVPAKLGWLDVTVGRYYQTADTRILEISDIGSKSDYVENGVEVDDRRAHALFSRVSRRLKARLHRPMMVRHISATSGIEHNIYYSEAAAEFYRHGGELRQWGVPAQRFEPPQT